MHDGSASESPSDAEAAAEAGRLAPAGGGSGYAPEYHCAARGLLEQMEASLHPLTSIPTKSPEDAAD